MAQALTTMQNDIRELKELALHKRHHHPADEENDADDEAEGKSHRGTQSQTSTSTRRSARLTASKNINMGKAPKPAWVNRMNVSLFFPA